MTTQRLRSVRSAFSGCSPLASALAFEPLEPRALLAIAVSDYFPLNIGEHWSYTGLYKGFVASADLEISAGGVVNGVSTRRTNLSIIGAGVAFTDTRYFSTAPGLRLMRRDQVDDGAFATESFNPGVAITPASVTLGGFNTYSGNGTGSIPSLGVFFTSTLSGRIDYFPEETVSTPAGVFRAIKVVRIGTESISAPGVSVFVNETETQWLVHGFGMVRVDRREQGVDSDGETYDDRYSFSLTGSADLAARRGFSLTGKGLAIVQDDQSPTTADGTNYGGIDVSGGLGIAGATKTRVFVIRNTGLASLSVLPVEISGAHAGEFTLVRLPAPSVAPGATTFFSIRFDAAAAGFRFATITLRTSDPLADPFVFTIRGTGLLFGVIGVKRSDKAQAIAPGSITPILADGTSLGRTTAIGSAFIDRTFVISNSGLGTLNLTGTPRVVITGVGAADYQIFVFPPSSIASGATATFVLRFNPSVTGARSAVVQILSSDRLVSLFTFAVVGTGQ